MKRVSPSVSLEEVQIARFRKDPRRAIGYLNASIELAFEDNDPELILIALAVVAKSYGMTKVAKEARIQRESLHRMLSKRGNPEWSSVFRLLKALHLRPRLERAKAA